MKTPAPQHRSRAFTIWDLLIVLVTAGLMVIIGLPWLARTRARSSRVACISNLKQVGLAFRIWAGDNRDVFPMQVSTNQGGSKEYVSSGQVIPHFLAISNELVSPKVLLCSDDKGRGPRVSEFPMLRQKNLSYFVGVDASETNSMMWLSGDRLLSTQGTAVKPGLLVLTTNDHVGWSIQLHNRGDNRIPGNNIVLADGSAQLLSSRKLPLALEKAEFATNRLAIP